MANASWSNRICFCSEENGWPSIAPARQVALKAWAKRIAVMGKGSGAKEEERKTRIGLRGSGPKGPQLGRKEQVLFWSFHILKFDGTSVVSLASSLGSREISSEVESFSC